MGVVGETALGICVWESVSTAHLQGMDKGEILLSPLAGTRRPDPKVMRTGELILPLTSYSTWDSRPCTSSGQQSRADLGDRDVGEPAPRV